MRALVKMRRRWREARMFTKAMASADHPILAQIIPIRRCNLACTYCNEFDKDSPPVPVSEMLRRIDRLGELGTSIITFSGGEPTLHPQLDTLIRRVRDNGAIATIITNGYLLVPERIKRLNAAGLDYLQISIDNVQPDDASKKSLRVLDRKLQWLAEYADFDITINSVLGSAIRKPEDAYQIAARARELGFQSTVGILHDDSGQLSPLSETQSSVYEQILGLGKGLFSFTHHDAFQGNIVRALPNQWHCPAGGRFLYICEDGLVHYCSQRRGYPGIPLEHYTREDLMREGAKPKGCAPFCTISCVHQTAMLDEFRTRPREALAGIIERRKERDASWKPPLPVRSLEWMFLRDSRVRDVFGTIALRLFRVAPPERQVRGSSRYSTE
ncbi:MAG: radical SAM protein [Acidobacteriaceae bacterium]|nr:radical SAM protein [Acidobacteriaceae bacterium]MBV9295905.1 radical SAM protein [Acidobacteriaceae bacterium]MBV9766937.1 radical SAM protein [Acidobacteriaceae bacterium]